MSGESATAIHKGQVDLLGFIDWIGVECLNQSTTLSVSSAIKQGYREDKGFYLEIDAYEQFLLYIAFTQVIKLYSIIVKGPEDKVNHLIIHIIELNYIINFEISIVLELMEVLKGNKDYFRYCRKLWNNLTCSAGVLLRQPSVPLLCRSVAVLLLCLLSVR
ncbi:unnamed protein product [Vicia faba]|uniref:PITH domain-containing protein n=1 Tax=Vicia faba TaxID=3906 RepID=A0AAV1A1S0_VICFA|nr:unnamed protein product [Vicia faba]